MMLSLGLALLMQAAAPPPPSTARPTRAQAEIPVQLGVNVTADTVTVGQRFVAIIRVRAPRGATIEFPTTSDSATAAAPTGMQLLGKPAVQAVPDSINTTMTAAYRLAAWDVGTQRLGLPDIVVRLGTRTGYVSLADRGVFVRSVLPADSTLRVPKPPRPAIEIAPFNWLPWLLALAALVAAGLLWRLWIWYRRRRDKPIDPFTAAEREFDRIESMHLVEAGEGERHAASMSDVMRDYLAARVPAIDRSQTSSELLASTGRIHEPARGLGELLWRTDLVKFANARVEPDEAERLGAAARAIVRAVEAHLVDEEKEPEMKAAA
ncbi:MAG: hypothetical protein ABI681_12440 [Gemmatimonadales bacterium]